MKKQQRCNRCGKTVSPHDSIVFSLESTAGEILCLKCANEETAERMGIVFVHPEYAPIKVEDFDGIEHEFHFVTRLIDNIVSMDALELKAGKAHGYEFSVIGDDPEENTIELYRKLVDRIRRSLAMRHLKENDFGLQIDEPGIVRARISSDFNRGGLVPLLIIDGKEISWAEFGRMVLTYEGFQLKMEMFDRSEER